VETQMEKATGNNKQNKSTNMGENTMEISPKGWIKDK